MKTNIQSSLAALALALSLNLTQAQGTAFTYNGHLLNGGVPVNGSYDLQFRIYDDSGAGNQVGGTVLEPGISVVNGLVTARVDFGAGVFTGPPRWLDIGVRPNGSLGGFTILSPRIEVTLSPYSIFSETAASANAVAGGIVGPGQLATTVAPAAGQVLTFGVGGLSWSDLPNPAPAWALAGNAGTTAGVNFLGTTDSQPLEFHVSGNRALLLQPDGLGLGIPNVIGGAANNSVGTHGRGNSIGGGYANSVGFSLLYGTIGGGANNVIQANGSTIAGGYYNSTQPGAEFATIGGGESNTNSSRYGTVPGGINNLAAGDYSFAAGQNAQALHAGSFVWADNSSFGSFASTDVNQFLIRAAGGVGIGVANPGMALDVQGRVRFRDGPSGASAGTAGIWLNTSWFGGNQDIGFMGVMDARRIGFYGNDPGGPSGWGLTFDTLTGNVGIGTGNSYPTSKLQVNGDASVCTLTITGGCDLAEPFEIAQADIPKGAVVVIDEERPGQLKVSDRAYDTRVAGIISGADGINPGISLRQQGAFDAGRDVALSGRVYALADASGGPIKPGDLLTTSNTPGHCMKAGDHAKTQGAVLGKAMSALDHGKGMVLVLVSLQ